MDTRRLILVLIFAFSSFMLWEKWLQYNQPKPTVAATQAAKTAADGNIPKPSVQTASSVAAPESSKTQGYEAGGETFAVKTDLLNATFSTLGGDIVELALPRYREQDEVKNPFRLFDAKHQYRMQSGLIGEGWPNHRSIFKRVAGPLELPAGQDELTVRFEASISGGGRIVKSYHFRRNSYQIEIRWQIEQAGTQAPATHAYVQLQRTDVAPDGETKMVSTFTGPAVYTAGEKYQKVDFADIAKGKAKFALNADNGWLAMVQHYFVAALVPPEKTSREFYMRKVTGSENLYQAGIITPLTLNEAGKLANSMVLYAGPQAQARLKETAPGLDLVVDYGWLTVVAAPIFWALEWIHKLVGNWGWAIVLLTVAIKAAFYPLSAASYKSMAKMRVLTPRLMSLKERYGDDRQRLNQEMMKLYQTEKVNPLGGCLPILIQIPVFIALYWVLLGAVEMRGAPWLGWITDLSAPDALLGTIPGINMPVGLLPIVMVATMLIQTKLNPTPPDPIQAKVMMMMPFMFGFMFFFFPSGLVLYWVVNNVLSIAQQWQITRMIEEGGKAANDAKA